MDHVQKLNFLNTDGLALYMYKQIYHSNFLTNHDIILAFVLLLQSFFYFQSARIIFLYQKHIGIASTNSFYQFYCIKVESPNKIKNF